jgi:hypothetical protein
MPKGRPKNVREPKGRAIMGETFPDFPLIYFLNPVVHDGLNLTVRRGDKWDGVRGVHEYKKSEPGKVLGRINIIETRTVVFADLEDNDDLLQFAHDPECRNFFKLERVMQQIYASKADDGTVEARDDGFKRDETVTLVFFIKVDDAKV